MPVVFRALGEHITDGRGIVRFPRSTVGVQAQRDSGQSPVQPLSNRERLLAGENGRGDPADAFGVGDRVDLDDPALDHREAQYGKWPAVHGNDRSSCSVHQDRVEQRIERGRSEC